MLICEYPILIPIGMVALMLVLALIGPSIKRSNEKFRDREEKGGSWF